MGWFDGMNQSLKQKEFEIFEGFIQVTDPSLIRYLWKHIYNESYKQILPREIVVFPYNDNTHELLVSYEASRKWFLNLVPKPYTQG